MAQDKGTCYRVWWPEWCPGPTVKEKTESWKLHRAQACPHTCASTHTPLNVWISVLRINSIILICSIGKNYNFSTSFSCLIQSIKTHTHTPQIQVLVQRTCLYNCSTMQMTWRSSGNRSIKTLKHCRYYDYNVNSRPNSRMGIILKLNTHITFQLAYCCWETVYSLDRSQSLYIVEDDLEFLISTLPSAGITAL